MLTEEKLESAKARFALQKIYLKDLSFESPISRLSGALVNISRFDIDFDTLVTKFENNLYEVCLNLTGKGLNEDEEVIYLIEVAQAGFFLQEGELEEELVRKITLADCPTILYPYVRETVDSVLVRGGWPPVTISHVDFTENYMKSLNSKIK